MNIAFDVKGTLESNDNAGRAMALLLLLHKTGHKVFVWSSVLSYAYRMTKKIEELYKFTPECYSKYGMYEAEEQNLPVMDFAVDDDMSIDYLAAKNYIRVHTLPANIEEFARSLGLLPKVD